MKLAHLSAPMTCLRAIDGVPTHIFARGDDFETIIATGGFSAYAIDRAAYEGKADLESFGRPGRPLAQGNTDCPKAQAA